MRQLAPQPSPVPARSANLLFAIGVLSGAIMSAGCTPQAPCVTEESSVTFDAETPFGGSLSSYVSMTGLEGQLPFDWYDKDGVLTFEGKGTSTTATYAITLDNNSGRFVSQEPNPENTNDDVPECPDYLEVEGTLDISTEDGWLAEEAMPLRLRYEQPDDLANAALRAFWGPRPEQVLIEDLAGLLPGGLSSSTGLDYVEIIGSDDLAAGVRLEVGTRSVIEANGAVGVGVGILGCGNTPETICPPPPR